MQRMRLLKVFGITVAWVLLAALAPVHDHLLYLAFNGDVPEYSLSRSIALTVMAASVGAPIAAVLVIFVIKERLRRHPFALVVLAHTATYLGVTIALTFFGNVTYYALELGRSPTDPETLTAALGWFTGPWTIKNLLFWTGVAALTSVVVELLDVLGPGFTKDFILGRYHRPKTEERCFMFLDVRSSTGLAEQLGHTEYFGMLNDFYADIADVIVGTRGQIYQYVGDEVVVTWPRDRALAHSNCVRCFFEIQRVIDHASKRYQSRYGVVPGFKAGFHLGAVTVGEIGVLKRDIVYSGDVLNTAARIQERCNHHGVDVLVSGDLIAALPHDATWEYTPVEEIALRGKAVATTLFHVRLAAWGVGASPA